MLVAVAWVPFAGTAYGQEVGDGVRIVTADPPNGYIDPTIGGDGASAGLRTFTVRFSGPVDVSVSLIQVSSSASAGPTVERVERLTDNSAWKVSLDRPLEAGELVVFAFGDAGAVAYEAVPGDVNQDGVLSAADRVAWLVAFDSGATEPRFHDVDGSGEVDRDDFSALARVLADVDGTDAQAGGGANTLAVCCADDFGACMLYLGKKCPPNTTPVSCPCVPM
ncbi:MAG: hypothetical protein ACE5E6_12275 [Phycisphaerae bacterium]